jgi:hypothetical protein
MNPEPELLASVRQKLLKGLPPLEGKATAQETPNAKPDPAPAPKG